MSGWVKIFKRKKPFDDGNDPAVGEDEGEKGEEVDQAEEGQVVESVHNSRLQQTNKLSAHKPVTDIEKINLMVSNSQYQLNKMISRQRFLTVLPSSSVRTWEKLSIEFLTVHW